MTGARVWARTRDVEVLSVVGFVGAVVIAVTSWWVGALRQARPTPVIRIAGVVHEVTPPVRALGGYVLFWVGLALLACAWLLLGHEVFHRRRVSRRGVRWIALLWATPLFFAAPVGSRDLWAYAAQANVATHGLNPYSHGPKAVAGAFSNQVSWQWVDQPSPYGPAWVWLTGLARVVLGSHPSLVAEAARVVTASGLLLLAWSIPIIADRVTGRAPVALWATVANPLFLVDGVAGGHNDLLMTALVAAALVAATNDWDLLPAMAVAGALVGLAATVKLPALIVVPFLAMIWTRRHRAAPAWRVQLSGTAVAAAACVLVCATFSVVSAFGLGWLHTGTTPRHSGGPIVIALVVIGAAVAWERARVWEPMAMLTAAIVTMLMVVPVGAWWYWLFPIAVAAPLLTRRFTAVVLAGISITLLTVVRPDGNAMHLRPEMVVCAALFTAWLVLDRTMPSLWRTPASATAPAISDAEPLR